MARLVVVVALRQHDVRQRGACFMQLWSLVGQQSEWWSQPCLARGVNL